MKIVDSHCHLDFDPLSSDINNVFKRARDVGVARLINVGASLRGSRASVEMANIYPNVWASVGFHPHEAETMLDIDNKIEEIETLAWDEKVIAIGEIGLDYYDPERPITLDQKKKQKELFTKQLELSQKLKLPLIIHVRDAWDDFFSIIQNSKFENQNSSAAQGVVHCFTGSEKEAKKILDLGFFLGFTGLITFDQPKFNHIRRALKIVPLDRILVETDAPFLAPEPFRGKTNEPAYVLEVIKKIAKIKSISIEEVVENTTKNVEKLFNIR